MRPGPVAIHRGAIFYLFWLNQLQMGWGHTPDCCQFYHGLTTCFRMAWVSLLWVRLIVILPIMIVE